MKLSSLIDFDWKRKNLHVPKGYVKAYATEQIWLDYDKINRELTITCRDLDDSDREPRWYKFDDKHQLSAFIKDLQEYEEDMW